MTIATEKIKPSSKRWTLVRVEPVRSVSESFEIVDPGGIFEADWPLDAPIGDLQFTSADAPLTRVEYATNDTEWSFDEETSTIRLVLLGATEIDLHAETLLAYYYLFYCSAFAGDTPYYQDPDDDSSELTNWEGRLESDPSVSAEFTDILAGVFSISNSTFTILNTDSDFEKYLGPNDSFYRRNITAWLFINGERQRSFTGKIASLQVGDRVAFNVLDAFTKLDDDALMGDSGTSVRIPTTAHPEDINKPIPLIIARDSYHQRNDDTALFTGATDAGEWIDGCQARCPSYSSSLGNTENRSWRISRTLAALQTQSFGSLTRAIQVDSVSVAFKFSSYSNVRIGDTMKWTELGTDYYGRVLAVGNFTFSGNSYDIRVVTDTPTISNSSTVTALKCLSAWIEGANSGFKTQFDLIYLEQLKDYSISETLLASGHYRISITLTSSVEANHGLDTDSEWIDPGRHRIKFALRTQTVTLSHGAILQQMVEAADLTPNAATFTQADVDLVENVAFMIPNRDETSYSPYRKYFTDFLAGTLGFVRMNNDDEVEYGLLQAVVAGDDKDENVQLDDGLQAEIEYQDIISAITPDNQHLPFTETKDLTKHESNRAKFLYGIESEIEFQHYMEAVDPSRIAEILAIRAERRVRYTYQTAAEDIDTVLGQDVSVSSPRVLGGSGSENIKVTGISKSAARTEVIATDLLGL